MRVVTLLLGLIAFPAWALVETPMLQEEVKAGKLPGIEKRLPQVPLVVHLGKDAHLGMHGGTLQSLAGRSRDTLTNERGIVPHVREPRLVVVGTAASRPLSVVQQDVDEAKQW